MSKENDFMNALIRGQAPAPTMPAGLTPAQSERVEQLITSGTPARQAIDTVTQRIPPGNAGSGTGQQPAVKIDMNDWIRRKAGH